MTVVLQNEGSHSRHGNEEGCAQDNKHNDGRHVSILDGNALYAREPF